MAGLSIRQVAIHLHYSDSTVSRIENGRITANISVVRDMLGLYHVAGQQKEAIEQLAREARQKETWWHAYGDVPDARTYASFERAARSIRAYESLIIPGLLQTRGYARTIISALFPDMPQEVELHVDLRMERQSLLLEDDPPMLSVVLDEAALQRLRGMTDVLQEQLDYLVKLAHLPNVMVQVIPLQAGAHGGMIGQFTILNFADSADPDLVHIEHRTGDLYFHRRDQVHRYEAIFERLQAAAYAPDESVAFVVDLARGRPS